MAYPGTIDSYIPVQGTTFLAGVDHAGQHNQAGSAVVALENKLGIGSGSAAINQILVGSGAGTTAWGTLWNNGALGSPTITGGTVNSAIFGTPTITGGTINSAVLGTPTIQSLADNTTGNVSTTAHGFAPKAPNDATKFLDGTGAYSTPVASALTSKTGSFTRDLTAASGDVAITGVGFIPTSIHFYAVVGSTSDSRGFSDSSKAAQGINRVNTSTYQPLSGYGSNTVIALEPASANYQTAIVKSYDADGFTLTWSKTSSPTGTATIVYIAYK